MRAQAEQYYKSVMTSVHCFLTTPVKNQMDDYNEYV